MEQVSSKLIRERAVAIFLVVLGVSSFGYSLIIDRMSEIRLSELLPLFLFTGAIIVADRYPIHITRGTKAILINLPIFLATVLLPAPLAILGAGTGLLIANLFARTERGLLPRDILSTVGQWMFMVFLGSRIITLSLPALKDEHMVRFVLLFSCALVFLLADFIIFSLSQTFIHGEPFIAVLKSVVREGVFIEVIQYLIAILGSLAAYQEIWSLILLIIPVFITYIAFKNLKETRFETIQILEDMADTVDLRDVYTGGHSKRVADLVHQILDRLEIAGPEATLIEIAARLHDIGKIGIPDQILKKPGKLLLEEMADMRTHSQKGASLISKYRDFARGATMILHHHERWDGTGYPSHLKGHNIPFGARVIAVADSFDAMTSDRPYRKALSADQALQTLLEGRGKQWEPSIVNALADTISLQLDENPKALEFSQQVRAPA